MKNYSCLYLIFILFSIVLFLPKIEAVNKYIVVFNEPTPIKQPYIEWVTVSENDKVNISWKKQVNENIDYYNVYRGSTVNDNEWDLVGRISYKSDTYLNDLNSYAQMQSYRYRISAVDKCGYEIFSNSIFKTIFLRISKTSDGKSELMWTPFEGGEVLYYRIYRGIFSDDMVLIDSVDSNITSYKDFNVNQQQIFYYQIEAIGYNNDDLVNKTNDIFYAKSEIMYIKSLSNKIRSIFSSLHYGSENELFKVYYNKDTNCFVVKCSSYYTQDFNLYVLDILGNVMLRRKIIDSEMSIDCETFMNGIYIFQIVGERNQQQKVLFNKNN